MVLWEMPWVSKPWMLEKFVFPHHHHFDSSFNSSKHHYGCNSQNSTSTANQYWCCVKNIFVSYKFRTESSWPGPITLILDLGMSTSGIKQKYKVSSRYSVVAKMIKDYRILKPVVFQEPSFLPKFRISKAITKFFLSFGNGNRTDAIWELLGMVKNRNFRSWLTSSKSTLSTLTLDQKSKKQFFQSNSYNNEQTSANQRAKRSNQPPIYPPVSSCLTIRKPGSNHLTGISTIQKPGCPTSHTPYLTSRQQRTNHLSYNAKTCLSSCLTPLWQ